MKYYLDTEFNGFNGELISLALVREDNEYLYVVEDTKTIEKMDLDPWVAENVIPILHDVPEHILPVVVTSKVWGKLMSDFMRKDINPQIICDWPSDAVYFAQLLMTGPGTAVPMSQQTHITILRHIDVYPTTLEGAVQHNAWWDAMAIKELVE